MKNKSYLFIIISVLTITAFGQKKNDASNWQIGIFASTIDKHASYDGMDYGIDHSYSSGARKNQSFALGIYTNYFYSEFNAVRLKFGISYNHSKEKLDHYQHPAGTDFSSEFELSQIIFNISPGILWNLKMNRINVFGGFEIPILIYDKLKTKGSSIEYSIISGNYILEHDLSGTTTGDGGLGMGPGVFTGFNVQLSKRILLGGEFSFALLYTKFGGDINSVGINNIDQTITTYNDAQQLQTYANPRLMAQLGISFAL